MEYPTYRRASVVLHLYLLCWIVYENINLKKCGNLQMHARHFQFRKVVVLLKALPLSIKLERRDRYSLKIFHRRKKMTPHQAERKQGLKIKR